MTWEEWSKQERVWDFRRGENPDPEMIRVANAYVVHNPITLIFTI